MIYFLIIINFFFLFWMLFISCWGRMFGHSNDGQIDPTMKSMKCCSLGSVGFIWCNDINQLNECNVVGIKFGTIMSQKSNVALINAMFHDVALHHSLFPSWDADLLPANTKYCIQLHLLTMASVLNATLAMIVNIHVKNWNYIVVVIA